MFAFASLLFQFLGGPVAKALVSAYQAHLTAATSDKQTAATLAGQEIAAQNAETQAITQLKIAQIGHPFEPEKIAMYITLVYYAKCIIWDKVLGLGTTDVVAGPIAVWAGLIMSWYFAKRGAENVTTIIRAIRN
ncbi:hypothetical protein [Bradyrhizobium elkanii]|jgi:hypothetical protein|uniref:hypothetical protein n=1 Tax=Bradyrhizobium elkanii TaxID=29448 RepID=UPI001449B972|nr:hypothetical protein [Bradyrhizobium elkanii]MCP1932504.1 hypothetical protein [Bradyrhizobium elkanii]MCS3479569.1 hypothetical protein [Bradyrhizobium elkanii]MCS3576957.1 hypothetical protein [Bradyrhizobium elkanii]MCS3719834.1 hypothetical protein [Bradyrhizobium elkanii]MCS4004251.1 hypothetical protein [Bradyrhizobium elkanii USDA 61]